MINSDIKTERKSKSKEEMKPKICYVFQGGGALGSYQVGAFKALCEEGYAPDMIVGISIGAINSAIIAGNAPENRLKRLIEFWDTITTSIPIPILTEYGTNKIHNWYGANRAMMFGQPGFFKPKLIHPSLLSGVTPDKISYYDTTPLRETLVKLIDFNYLNQKHIRLCLGTVELGYGEFIFFDSFEQDITPEHIMASCSLPPSFPPTKIADKYYIDGGVYANTPLSRVLDDFADHPDDVKRVLCFMIDLFSATGDYPNSLDGLLGRVKDIQYSSHSKRQSNIYSTSQNLSHAINYLSSLLTDEQRQDPKVQEIIKLGYAHPLDIVHLIYHSQAGTELESRDYNFSKETCAIHKAMGYTNTKNLLVKQHYRLARNHKGSFRIYTQDNILETKFHF